MPQAPDTIPDADLLRDADAAFSAVRDSGRPLVITREGRPAAVLLSIETFERSERERNLLLMLARGEREAEEGRGHDLDDVLAEIDALLASDRP